MRGATVALLVVLVFASMAIASGGAESLNAGLERWSDPVVIAETSIAVPPILLPTADRLHLLWVDRQGGTAVLFYGALDARGTLLSSPQPLVEGVDARFGWPVAVAAGDRIVVVWMARGADNVQLMGAVLGSSGKVVAPAHPLAPVAEESGSIAILGLGRQIHVAWSQFDHGQRRIWYLQLAPDGVVMIPPRPVAGGDSPSLAAGTLLQILWWESTGFDTHRLMLATVREGSLIDPRPITAPILQGRVSPVLATSESKGLDVLMHLVERGFGSTERLYHVHVGTAGPMTPEPLLQARSVYEIAGSVLDGRPLVVWTGPAGRSRHLEVYAARFDPGAQGLVDEARVTYTVEGSLHPTITATGGTVYVTWLQVTGVSRYRVAVATNQHAPRRWFLFDVPELDLFHPGRLMTFVATVLLTILPLVMLYSVGFSFPAMVIALLGTAVFGGFHWWQVLLRQRSARLALFLVAVLVFQLAGRLLIPGAPGGFTLLAALVIASASVVVLTRGRMPGQALQLWLLCGAILCIQLAIVLFPWGVRQLTQF